MLLRGVDQPADLGDLDRLFTLVAECDGHFPIGEHKYLDLVTGKGTPKGSVGVVAGEIVAYLAVTPPRAGGPATLEIAVHPLHRSHEVFGELIGAGTAAAREAGAEMVRVWAFQPKLVDELLLAGFSHERELRQLRVSLPLPGSPPAPDGVRLRTFRPGVDEEEWLAVNNAAFWDHPENGTWTTEILADRMAQPWFDPEGFLMAWEGDDLAGFCWTKPHDDLGEIYVIAVAPGHQGRGLGRYLTVAGLDVIHRRYGFDEGMLYMDAGNTVAAALYESLGFRLHHVDRSLVLRLSKPG